MGVTLLVVPLAAANGTKGHLDGCVLPRDCASGLCRLYSAPLGLRCAAADNSLGKYALCGWDAECNWGKCFRADDNYSTNLCGCTSDSMCASSEFCNNDNHRCEAKLLRGSTCTRKAMCASDSCQVCGTTGLVPVIPKMLCAETGTRQLGQTCNFDKECSKGKCSVPGCLPGNGVCVCKEDSDCASNQKCRKGPLGIGVNECVPK